MLGTFQTGPIMRSFFLLIALLMPAWSGAAPAVPAPAAPLSSCVLAPASAGEPPAWVLLAAAVLLLGAGRLAAP